MMRKLSALLILLAGTAWGAGGTQNSLTVSSGTYLGVDLYLNTDGASRQAIVLGDFTSSDTVRVDQITGMRVSLSTSALTTTNGVKIEPGQSGIPIVSTNTLNVSAAQSGTWTVQPGNTANTTAWKVDGSAVTQPVSGTFWQATQPISGTVTASQTTAASLKASVLIDGTSNTVQLTGAIPAGTNAIGTVTVLPGASNLVVTTTNTIPVSGTFFPTTQPVYATGITTMTTLTGTGASASVGYATSGSSVPVNVLNTVAISGSLSANQSVNVAQINGVTPLMGNGVTGTGSPRVTIASDNLPQVVNLSTSVANAANTTVVYVSTFANVAASQTAQILVAGIASTKLRVVNVALMAGGTATNVTFNTNSTAMSPLFAAPANGGIALQRNDMGWFETVSGDPLTITTGAGSTTGVIIGYLKI